MADVFSCYFSVLIPSMAHRSQNRLHLAALEPEDFIITGRYFRLLQPDLIQCVWLYDARSSCWGAMGCQHRASPPRPSQGGNVEGRHGHRSQITDEAHSDIPMTLVWWTCKLWNNPVTLLLSGCHAHDLEWEIASPVQSLVDHCHCFRMGFCKQGNSCDHCSSNHQLYSFTII